MIDQDFASKWLNETMRLNNYDNLAKILYKYLSPKSEFFDITIESFILKNQIYLPSRTDFNDPFDCRINFKVLANDENEEYVEYLKEIHRQSGSIQPLNLDLLRCQITRQSSSEESLNRLGVYSMSATIKSASMWAHYGSNHEGVALIFNNAVDNFGGIPVRYQSKRNEFDIRSDRYEYEVLVKGSEWAYEKEYRYTKVNSAKQVEPLPEGAVLGIVFGANCSDNIIKKVVVLNKTRSENGLKPLLLLGIQVNLGEFNFDIHQLNVDSMSLIKLPSADFY